MWPTSLTLLLSLLAAGATVTQEDLAEVSQRIDMLTRRVTSLSMEMSMLLMDYFVTQGDTQCIARDQHGALHVGTGTVCRNRFPFLDDDGDDGSDPELLVPM